MAITSFTGEYRFLSNFYPVEISYGNEKFPSVEHAYQAAKTHDRGYWEVIKRTDAKGAKKTGKKVPIRPDWEQVKVSIMRDLVMQKFQKSELKEQLLATGDKELIEGNWWGDKFWGKCNGEGKNVLGEILMEVREWLSSQSTGTTP